MKVFAVRFLEGETSTDNTSVGAYAFVTERAGTLVMPVDAEGRSLGVSQQFDRFEDFQASLENVAVLEDLGRELPADDRVIAAGRETALKASRTSAAVAAWLGLPVLNGVLNVMGGGTGQRIQARDINGNVSLG